MLLSEFFTLVRRVSGTWLTKLENLEMSLEDFKSIVDHALAEFNRYIPIHRENERLYLSDDGQHVFENDEVYGLPVEVCHVAPALGERAFSSFSSIFGFTGFNRVSSNREVDFRYRSPRVYTNWVGDVDITTLHYQHVVPQNDLGLVTPHSANTGNGVLSISNVRAGVATQTYVFTCIRGGLSDARFSVQGSVIGTKPEFTMGNTWSSTDFVPFIVPGSTPFVIGDIFTVTIVERVPKEWALPLFDETKHMLLTKLVHAHVLIALGGSRRAFKQGDLPIDDDAAEMVADGQNLERATMEELAAHSQWWMAVG